MKIVTLEALKKFKEKIKNIIGDSLPINSIVEIPDDMIVPDGWEEIPNETNIVNSFSGNETDKAPSVQIINRRLGSHSYMCYMNSLEYSSVDVYFDKNNSFDRKYFLVFGVTNSLTSILSMIVFNDTDIIVKNMGEVQLTVDKHDNYITINGLTPYTYISVISPIKLN